MSDTTAAQPLLQVTGVDAGYHAASVLHGVSLAVYDREVVTIIGPNGAGKSTLLKVIMGYLIPTAGEVRLREQTITRLATDRRVRLGIAYVPQLENVFPSLTVLENLRMGGYLLPADEVNQRIEARYAEFPVLAERRHQRVQTLSGGQRQMLAIARAMMTDPELVLLDEPSAALSPAMTDEVFDQVLAIRDRGKAVLIVEQNAERSLAISHRGYLLVDGRNAFDDRAEAILTNEQIRGAFLGAPIEDSAPRNPA